MTNQLQTAPVASLDTPLSRLLEMLTYRRPAGSTSETAFIERFIDPTGASRDDFDNLWLTVGKSRTLWSSHTDSVHAAPGRQTVKVRDGMASADKSSCLGADCAVGVWLMLEMIAAGIPGCYVFHRAEEVGGRGSSYIAKHYPDILEQYQFAIAFDRRDGQSIITHQGGRRCASDAFVASIAPMLPPGYSGDDGGLFTDTANYVDLIAECTNLSVGYSHEHMPHETLDLAHALKLRDAMLTFNESRLVAARDKSAVEYDNSLWSGYGTSWLNEIKPVKSTKSAKSDKSNWRDDDYYYGLLEFCRSNPDIVADFLETQGFTIHDLDYWRG